jgi:hypothetical protein
MASEAHPGLSPQNIKLKQTFAELGATPFYEKCLTNSDTGTQGRVVIPKVCAAIRTLFKFVCHIHVSLSIPRALKSASQYLSHFFTFTYLHSDFQESVLQWYVSGHFMMLQSLVKPEDTHSYAFLVACTDG